MAEYIGFTKKEVKKLCKIYLEKQNKIENNIQNISNKKRKLNSREYKETSGKLKKDEELVHKNTLSYVKIKNFYFGYHLINTKFNKEYNICICSPDSIVKALKYKKIDVYLKEDDDLKFQNIIEKNYKYIKDVIPLLMENKKVNIKSLNYQNDKTSFEKRKNILILLVHLGYLEYNNETDEIYIPNKEIFKMFEQINENINVEELIIETEIFNPGEKEYSKIAGNDYFVDKTKLILLLNEIISNGNEKNVCITRPTRFGKTVATYMIAAYYSFSESKISVFDDKKITENEEWNK